MKFFEKQVAADKIVQRQKSMLDEIRNLASVQARAGHELNQPKIDSIRVKYDALERDRIAIFQDEIDSAIADRCVAALGNRFAE